MRRAIAAFIKGMYVYDKEMGIIYENIAAKSLGRDTRSGLYSLLGIDHKLLEELNMMMMIIIMIRFLYRGDQSIHGRRC